MKPAVSTTVAEKRQLLYSLMGDLPARDRQVTVRLVKREEVNGYILETLVLDLNGIELVPAYFVKPVKGAGPFPTILLNHSHGGMYEQGKLELLRSHSYLPNKPFAEALTGQGYAALCSQGRLRRPGRPGSLEALALSGGPHGDGGHAGGNPGLVEEVAVGRGMPLDLRLSRLGRRCILTAQWIKRYSVGSLYDHTQ